MYVLYSYIKEEYVCACCQSKKPIHLEKLSKTRSKSQNKKCNKVMERKPKNNGKERANPIMTWNDRRIK